MCAPTTMTSFTPDGWECTAGGGGGGSSQGSQGRRAGGTISSQQLRQGMRSSASSCQRRLAALAKPLRRHRPQPQAGGQLRTGRAFTETPAPPRWSGGRPHRSAERHPPAGSAAAPSDLPAAAPRHSSSSQATQQQLVQGGGCTGAQPSRECSSRCWPTSCRSSSSQTSQPDKAGSEQPDRAAQQSSQTQQPDAAATARSGWWVQGAGDRLPPTAGSAGGGGGRGGGDGRSPPPTPRPPTHPPTSPGMASTKVRPRWPSM